MLEKGEFSVLISIYISDSFECVKSAIDSVIDQSLPPSQLVIVLDGPVATQVRSFVFAIEQRRSISCTVIELERNVGLGNALKLGIDACSFDLVARMDADDISVRSRFEQQITFLRQNPEVSVVGGNIIEFDSDTILGQRIVKRNSGEVSDMFRIRNGINHVTVMFRKADVLAAGSYRDFPSYEDYDLWIRMVNHSFLLANIDSVLVFVRAGDDMIKRRSGLHYLKKDFRFFWHLKQIEFINIGDLLKALLVRVPVRMCPNLVGRLVYSRLRKKIFHD